MPLRKFTQRYTSPFVMKGGCGVLTFFTTAKPFRGHSWRIQRNALTSCKLVHPDEEVILFGDDEGAAEAARELGLRYEPYVERDEYGTKRLDYMFTTARAIARHEVLCYINCDIILIEDFRRALERVKAEHEQFLMVGRRWDVEMADPCDFTQANWRSHLQALALMRGVQRTPEWIDYFAFNRGLYGSSVPPFVVGRVHWDHWLVWKARASKQPVVDVSAVVIAVHQNHDYGYHPQGRQGVWHGLEAGQNHQLAGGGRYLRTIADATEVLRAEGLKSNRKRYWSAAKRGAVRGERFVLFDILQPIAFFVLGITRPLRGALGLRSGAQRRSRENA
jgi:hypothetical protein